MKNKTTIAASEAQALRDANDALKAQNLLLIDMLNTKITAIEKLTELQLNYNKENVEPLERIITQLLHDLIRYYMNIRHGHGKTFGAGATK